MMTVFLNDNSVFLFAWFSNCTCDSFLRILLASGEREQWNGERIGEGGMVTGREDCKNIAERENKVINNRKLGEENRKTKDKERV